MILKGKILVTLFQFTKRQAKDKTTANSATLSTLGQKSLFSDLIQTSSQKSGFLKDFEFSLTLNFEMIIDFNIEHTDTENRKIRGNWSNIIFNEF